MYIILSVSEDGIRIEEVSPKELKKRLEERYYGDREILDCLPRENDPMYWRLGLIILKGEVFVPKPVQRVTEYEIP